MKYCQFHRHKGAPICNQPAPGNSTTVGNIRGLRIDPRAADDAPGFGVPTGPR
jgi:hypothetical protein